MPDYSTFPVAKVVNGKARYFGYADAQQVAKSRGKLVPYDAELAAAAKAKEDTAKAAVAAERDRKAEAEATEKGADPSEVRKGPKK